MIRGVGSIKQVIVQFRDGSEAVYNQWVTLDATNDPDTGSVKTVIRTLGNPILQAQGGPAMNGAVLARCAYGGPVPCVDDLCHGSDQTLCGMERYHDFCNHGFLPDTCEDCTDDEEFL